MIIAELITLKHLFKILSNKFNNYGCKWLVYIADTAPQYNLTAIVVNDSIMYDYGQWKTTWKCTHDSYQFLVLKSEVVAISSAV